MRSRSAPGRSASTAWKLVDRLEAADQAGRVARAHGDHGLADRLTDRGRDLAHHAEVDEHQPPGVLALGRRDKQVAGVRIRMEEPMREDLGQVGFE